MLEMMRWACALLVFSRDRVRSTRLHLFAGDRTLVPMDIPYDRLSIIIIIIIVYYARKQQQYAL